MSYQERLHTQLIEWVKGNPVHNYEDGECCPDFSCCYPDLLAPAEVRKAFCNAETKGDNDTKSRMLGEFLSKFLEAKMPDKNVHIAGLEEQRRELE